VPIRHMSVRKRTHHGREGSAGAAMIEKPTRAIQRVGGLGVRKARAKALDYCDKSVELRTRGGTVADACDRDSTRQISAGQRFSPTSLTCPAVKPSYRSSQLVCPGTARESPREGDHTHTCLKCKKLEELRQTDRAAKNPEHVASTHERAQAHGSWEGGQCGGRGDRKAHHNSRNSNTTAELLPRLTSHKTHSDIHFERL